MSLRPMRRHGQAIALSALLACHVGAGERGDNRPSADAEASRETARALAPDAGSVEATLRKQRLSNVVAYIPPQCFARTHATGSVAAKNPCYVCHGHSAAPNYNDDGDLQLSLLLPLAAATNPWTNLFAPLIAGAPKTSDAEVRAYVATSNYFDNDGALALATPLTRPPDEWDIDGNGSWDGYKPDVWFRFDNKGFDHRPDGTPTGWRAFGYYPFPGAFFPTNGSADDVLIRLDPRLQQDRQGKYDPSIYELNLAIVEALLTRSDVAIDPVDETAAGVDLDLDGHLGRASRVAFDAAAGDTGGTRMHYAGLAGEEERAGRLRIAPGLFPLGTEFFHTVRYLDLDASGAVTTAARMKEVRYAKKTAYLDYATLRGRAALDAREQAVSRDGARRVNWRGERGIDNGQGWVFQGFIEDAGGALRPQTREETTYCAGCHGGIGATSDSIFSFSRKLGGALARGWFHWSQRDIRGIPEPKRADGQYEYTMYLQQAGGGDDFRTNAEVANRFFDARGALRPDEVSRLHGDIARLLLPSPSRALDLDRAYRAVVLAQGFAQGRDGLLGATENAYQATPLGAPTGVKTQVALARLVRTTND